MNRKLLWPFLFLLTTSAAFAEDADCPALRAQRDHFLNRIYSKNGELQKTTSLTGKSATWYQEYVDTVLGEIDALEEMLQPIETKLRRKNCLSFQADPNEVEYWSDADFQEFARSLEVVDFEEEFADITDYESEISQADPADSGTHSKASLWFDDGVTEDEPSTEFNPKSHGGKRYVGKLLKSFKHTKRKLREVRVKNAEIQMRLAQAEFIDQNYKNLVKKTKKLSIDSVTLSQKIRNQKNRIKMEQ